MGANCTTGGDETCSGGGTTYCTGGATSSPCRRCLGGGTTLACRRGGTAFRFGVVIRPHLLSVELIGWDGWELGIGGIVEWTMNNEQ